MRLFFADKIRAAFVKWLSAYVQKPRDFPLSDFERIQYELRVCDVLLIEGRTRVSQVIKLITQSNWSHACLYIGRLHDIADAALRERVSEFYHGDPGEQLLVESKLGQGIIVSPLTDYQKDHIRICRPHGISRQDAQRILAYAITRLGVHYDVRQIFDLARLLFPWAILPRRWRSSLFVQNTSATTKESCSSLIAEAFQSVGFPLLPTTLKRTDNNTVELIERNPRLFTPSDFDYSPYFDIIKYPILELTEVPLYRKLPWNKMGILSNDEGRLQVPAGVDSSAVVGESKKSPPESENPLQFFD